MLGVGTKTLGDGDKTGGGGGSAPTLAVGTIVTAGDGIAIVPHGSKPDDILGDTGIIGGGGKPALGENFIDES